MPPKTVKCCVCGEEVMKSQTSFVPKGFKYIESGFGKQTTEDGRACNKHSGVCEIKNNLAETQKAKALSNNLPPKRGEYDPAKDPFSLQNLKDPNTHCWTCEKKCMSHQEFLLQQMVALKELESEGRTDWVLNPSIIRNKMNENGCIDPLIAINLTEKDSDLIKYVRPTMRFAVEMLSQVRVCPGCMKNLNLTELFKKKLGTPTIEQLSMLSAAFKVSGLNDLITEAAKENIEMKEVGKQ